MNLPKALLVTSVLFLSAIGLAPSAQADTCALSDDLEPLEPAVCGAILYGFCLINGAPKQTVSRVVKDCDVSLLG